MSSLSDLLKNCCLKDNYCGPYTRFKSPIIKLFKIKELDSPVEKHFKDLKLLNNYKESSENWNERKLIENRAGRTLLDEDEICQYHRCVKGYCFKFKIYF